LLRQQAGRVEQVAVMPNPGWLPATEVKAGADDEGQGQQADDQRQHQPALALVGERMDGDAVHGRRIRK
jgi:hypothetical protein